MDFLGNALDWAKEHLSDWSLIKVYLGCAIAGGTVLIGQAGLNLFGLGGDTDTDADVSADDLDVGEDSLHLISIRTMAAFLTLFGLVGWMGTARGWGGAPTALAAFAAGSSVMFAVALMMRFFYRLQSDGNLDPRNAIGRTATVYLRVPGNNAGRGKVTVELQGRTVEYGAITHGDELPTGAGCRLVDMTTEDTFRVEALS